MDTAHLPGLAAVPRAGSAGRRLRADRAAVIICWISASARAAARSSRPRWRSPPLVSTAAVPGSSGSAATSGARSSRATSFAAYAPLPTVTSAICSIPSRRSVASAVALARIDGRVSRSTSSTTSAAVSSGFGG